MARFLAGQGAEFRGAILPQDRSAEASRGPDLVSAFQHGPPGRGHPMGRARAQQPGMPQERSGASYGDVQLSVTHACGSLCGCRISHPLQPSLARPLSAL
jgi:hypothetical protein